MKTSYTPEEITDNQPSPTTGPGNRPHHRRENIMKYHKHEIKKVPTDLGEENKRDNFTYEIYKDGAYINTALTLSTAKEYIDSDYNDTYL
jgi:hypothetical protein